MNRNIIALLVCIGTAVTIALATLLLPDNSEVTAPAIGGLIAANIYYYLTTSKNKNCR